MEEEDVLCRFGTPLEPLEEDEIPSKKPITIEDQIVTDSNGRRRFHGAFTGGFSAGFWNTVGSLEGWKPQNFKSSRYEKAEKLAQTPTDFMDDEDLGEFGIAPQRIQTTDDFTPQESSTKDRKRKLQQPSGPIPGIPVLHQLLQPAKEIVAIRLLKRMGWKAGQGIGARQTRREKKVAKERNARERYVMKKYGCDLGPLQSEKLPSKTSDGSSSDESDISDEEITFAPDDFDPYVCSIKDNSFGLGYSGLDRNPVLKKQQHIDLFGPFEVMGKGNKKLSIRGQAFGVGALEEEDEDIYAKDDMTKYDFSLDDSKNKQKKKQKMEDDKTIIDGFHSAKIDATKRKKVFRVPIPAGFKPRNWSVRKTRFEPLDEIKTALLKKKDEHKTKGLGRHDLNPDERGSILGENAGTSKPIDDNKPSGKFDKKTYIQKVNEKYQSKEKEKDILEIIGSRIDNFTQGGIVNTSLEPPTSSVDVVDENVKKENDKIQQDALNITKCLDKKPTIFKPFINNEPKQERYDKFLEADLSDDAEIDKFLASIQPLSMTDWDREMEKKEFLQAKRIYKPLKGLMSERFVTESTATAERITTQKSSTSDKKIEIVRTKTMWKPCAQLCKRFNVAEPFGGTMIDQKVTKRARFSVFDYIEVSVNKKDDFVTPVIIPTKSEKPKPIIHQDMTSKSRIDNNKLETEPTSSRTSARDIFTKATSSSADSAKSPEHSKDLPIKFNPTKKSDTGDLIISKDKDVSYQTKTPKSALEKKIEESRTKHPSEKKDLFKLIFESSSEDEEDESEATKEKMDEKSTTNPQISKNVLHSLNKTAEEINILRNTSPPRGLFAFLLEKKPESSEAAKDSNSATSVSPENKTSANSADKDLKKQDLTARKSPEIEGIYGPMPPAIVPSIQIPSSQTIDVQDKPTSTEASEVDSKILKLLKKTKSKKIVEEWVEKPKSNKEKKKKKDKDKKRKKHKKDKKKHKDKK